MSQTTKRPTIDTLDDLIAAIEIQGFTTFEVRGRRLDGFAELDGLADDLDEEAGVVPAGPLDVGVLSNDELLSIRVGMSVVTSAVSIDVDIAVHYAKEYPFEPSPDVVRDFIAQVALMILYPYLRETVSSTAQRLGETVTLRFIKPGSFSPNDED